MQDVSVIHAPFSLMPTPFPAAEFKRVQSMMPHLSSLVHAVSNDLTYLHRNLMSAAQFDSFTKGLIDVHNKTADSRGQHASPITLGLHRSDYMLDEPSGDLLQVRWRKDGLKFHYLAVVCCVDSTCSLGPLRTEDVCKTKVLLHFSLVMHYQQCL